MKAASCNRVCICIVRASLRLHTRTTIRCSVVPKTRREYSWPSALPTPSKDMSAALHAPRVTKKMTAEWTTASAAQMHTTRSEKPLPDWPWWYAWG